MPLSICGRFVASALWLSFLTAAQQLDPIQNMCYRIFHQSVVKNNILYIDGGIESFINVENRTQVGNVTQGYNEYLIAIDLTKSWDWKSNISEVALNKSTNPNPSTGTAAPNLVNGVLYHGGADDPNIYLYGGTTSYWNVSFPGFQFPPPSQQYVLWSYNTITGVWGQYDISSGSPWRPSNGFHAEASDQSLAFYMNGEIDSGSSDTTDVLGDYVKIFLEGMVVVNTTAQTAVNISTSAVSGDQPRTRGRMVEVRGIGDHGILVAIGGTYKPVDELDSEETANYVVMSEVDVFDIGAYYRNDSSEPGWYKQNATGDVPQPRAEFCAVVMPAPDNSSHNIYVYGGAGPNNQYYDDIYVLSLPSFIWTQVYGPGQSPRWGHECHAVGRQLITVGGASTWGTGSPCDWESKGVGILDVNTMIWGSVYTANSSNYEVPDNILAVIGGANGTAPMNEPRGGFDNQQLAQLFGMGNVTSITPTTQHKSTDTKAIIGGAVGGVAGALLIVAIPVWIIVGKKRRAIAGQSVSAPKENYIAPDVQRT